jgi:hypothetical protein
MLDRAVLTGGIHGLKDEQQRPAVLGIELVLQLRHALHPLRQDLGNDLLAARLSVVGGDRTRSMFFRRPLHRTLMALMVVSAGSAVAGQSL